MHYQNLKAKCQTVVQFYKKICLALSQKNDLLFPAHIFEKTNVRGVKKKITSDFFITKFTLLKMMIS